MNRGENKPLIFTLTKNEDGTQRYNCNVCDKHFKRRDLVSQHHKMVHLRIRPQLRSCHICKAKVRTRKRASHMELEHGIPAPICGACGRKFAFPSEVIRHQKLYHMGERNYKCEVCNFKCKSINHLGTHKMTHAPERPFKCEICKKTFKWKNGLGRHMMIHLNVRPHVCGVCQEAFVQKTSTVIYGDFTRIREADGSESFACNVCKNVYKKRTSFTQHYKHVHLKQRPKLRGCHLCDVKVPGHMRAFHMETHGLPAPSCGACGKKFAFPWQVLQHQKFFHMGEKQFRCEICNLNFEYKRQLDHHSIKHTPLKPFKCDVCDKCFRWRNNLKKHMMIHLNIRPHVCKHCQEAFVQSSSLNYHIKTKHPELE
ncbi:jg5976 [Pararge aegeria aegeria]|uniref:Jg5976 protein n=1 Tax=Pararge aegeria aegeria TaxID=348720 RepID=A0A8S4S8Y2_9NEOP|nr:jg5976 [Pararge aegeria aegeria]